MKLKHALNIVSVLTVLAFGILNNNANAAATALPFADGFESGFTGDDNPWSTNSSGDHIVLATAAAAISGGGAAGLTVSNATVTLNIASGNANVWLQIYALPVVGTDDPSVSLGQRRLLSEE